MIERKQEATVIKKLKEYRSGLVNYQKMFEDLYYNFRERNKDRFDKYQNLTDILFLGAYLAATTMAAVFTLRYIQHPADESHQFTSFMMESYGVPEGLLRTQGIEVLQLAGIVGLAYIIREAWLFYKGMEIDTEIRLGLMYTYMAIGISKHIHGILSWL